MQRNYLNQDNELTMVIPCASAETDLVLPIAEGKLTAFQLFCLDLAKLSIVLPNGTRADITSPSAATDAAVGAQASETPINRALNNYFAKQSSADARTTSNTGAASVGTQNEGKAHEVAAYKALEAFDYPTAAAEFKEADKDYPTLRNARELSVLLGALRTMKAENPAQCPALTAILGPYK